MIEVRFSQKADVPYLKDIWKVCFGDDDKYIDFFFNNKYKENETLILTYNKDIAAMLTIVPIHMVMPNSQRYNSAMLYAIATHPKYQGKGFSTQIMDYTKEYLKEHQIDILTLVPAEDSLIDFYSKRGYKVGFYIRETVVTYGMIKSFVKDGLSPIVIIPAAPEEYNNIRNQQLQGRVYIEYSNKEIDYQKKLSKQSGADIYIIDIGGILGCAAVERVDNEKVIIKELLIPEHLIYQVLIDIAEILPAKEYILRLPVQTDGIFVDSTKAFGMINSSKELNIDILDDDFGYLGFAYD